MSLEAATNATPCVAGQSQPGLQALGSNSRFVQPANSRLCSRSLDIDTALAAQPAYAHVNRWDYALEYAGNVYFLEVHPASTSEVATMLVKLAWLKAWLRNEALAIGRLPRGQRPFLWAATGKVAILPGSKQDRLLAQAGLKPEKIVRLP